ncbi:MAG: 1-deoxy-D-xylulose-5-phosphate reductoisomerase [Deferribacteraceae bacterium]|jgi:1-deoxy-D-xylulose-5-phosphate reductoisomerase|nr:1-deoxy-D-xylulose-5-phosphate reductoisomerase [Deferribacteraceae bacterium]
MKRKAAVIGATGSIGCQTADVLYANSDRFETVLLTAHEHSSELECMAGRLKAKRWGLTSTTPLSALLDIDIDIAVIAASGSSATRDIYELAKRGITLAIANKESIVMAGKFITAAAKQSGGVILPVDSEHSAIFQCLKGNDQKYVSRLVLTASGGAFRSFSPAELKDVTVKQAIEHPNWKMGKKISVDSATMMNKGLELIEASCLFDIPPDKLDVVIHPESLIHSFVAFTDSSVLAQAALADMRIPIAYALGYPDRIDSCAKEVDFTIPFNLTFHPPEKGRYPCFELAKAALIAGRQADIIALNAANDIAVSAFLTNRIGFTMIKPVVEKILMREYNLYSEPNNIDEVLDIDRSVRSHAAEVLEKFLQKSFELESL